MRCDTCTRSNDDKTKGTCEKCMAAHFKGNDDAFYEPIPKKKFTVHVFYKDSETVFDEVFGNVVNHYFMDKWLVIEGIGHKTYLRVDNIQRIEVEDE